MTITLTQKEFDLLTEVANHVVVDDKYLVKGKSNGALPALLSQGLVTTRQAGNNPLMVEVAILDLGKQVVNNEIEHDIVLSHNNPPIEEKQMEQANAEVAETTTATTTAQVAHGQFVIEDDVPMPEIIPQRARRENTMPLDKMNVGQSFLVPFREGEDPVKGRKRVGAIVSQTKKRQFPENSPVQFVVVKVDNGYRVWRKV